VGSVVVGFFIGRLIGFNGAVILCVLGTAIASAAAVYRSDEFLGRKIIYIGLCCCAVIGNIFSELISMEIMANPLYPMHKGWAAFIVALTMYSYTAVSIIFFKSNGLYKHWWWGLAPMLGCLLMFWVSMVQLLPAMGAWR